MFPNVKAGVAVRHKSGGNTFGGTNKKPVMEDMSYGDSGSAARFFYCAKAGRAERDEGLEGSDFLSPGQCTNRKDGSAGLGSPRAGAGRTNGGRNMHPTVKPVDLMRYLVTLVCREGGTVLDPFMGSGTTGIACIRTGRKFIGIEKDARYFEIAKQRLERESRQGLLPLPHTTPPPSPHQPDLLSTLSLQPSNIVPTST
jgi:site-specific DNA-methyltransferase (adenine-specific)